MTILANRYCESINIDGKNCNSIKTEAAMFKELLQNNLHLGSFAFPMKNIKNKTFSTKIYFKYGLFLHVILNKMRFQARQVL